MTTTTTPVGADAILWTAPIRQEENGDCLFAYVAPKPKRVAAIGTATQEAVHVQALPELAQVTDADMMEIDLLAVQLGLRPSYQKLTPAQIEAMNREAIGPQCQWDGTRGIE